MYVKKLLRMLLTSESRSLLRRWKRKFHGIGKGTTSLEDLRRVLVDDLGVCPGDKLIVSSGFGSLGAEDYSPKDVIELLQSIVTERGLIMMPYYPPKNSFEWASSGEVFDMTKTKSGMGIVTNIFSKMEDVYMSIHPTKAVCVWGNGAQEIILGHEFSQTPFYWDSPYGKLLKMGSKSLGLGVGNIPIFHTFEDVWDAPRNLYYQEKQYDLDIILPNQEQIKVKTLVHQSYISDRLEPAAEYTRNLKAKSYRRLPFGKSFVWIADNTELSEITKRRFEVGQNRFKR